MKSYGGGWKRRPRNIDSHVYVTINTVTSSQTTHWLHSLILDVSSLSSFMYTSRPLPAPRGAGSELIRTIRARHGFDDDPSARHPAVPELRGKLERALERLSNDLYNKKTHFLLEVVQNADDNVYGASIVPTLRLRIEDRFVVFECNELGFKAANVEAICDIGRSTKPREKNPRGFIGEKGIGFKSVFTVADQVYISSGPYSFHFDKTAPLGMITPILGSRYPAVRGWTTFHLHLAPSENGNDLSTQLRDVRPTLLLFLRQLRILCITIPGVTLEVRRTDDGDRDMVSLERIVNGTRDVERYILVRHIAQTPFGEPGREDVKESEIVLAFPVTKNQEPVTMQQDVHAFLPLRCYGFKFIIQGDFMTSASREDVLADKPWNDTLRKSVVDAFLLAIDRFKDHPVIRNVWFRYLPEFISDSFFCYVEHKLLEELFGKQILRSLDGTYHCAFQLFFLPSSFCDESGTPLIPEAYLPHAHHYLSSDYDIRPDGQDRQTLRRLGVREMTGEDFLAGLAIMDRANMFGMQNNAWHDAVATCILHLPRPSLGTIYPEVLRLRILPLSNGDWVPAALASTLTFPPGVNIPDDLGLQSIVPGISPFSPRYKLFLYLRVMPPNPVPIARKILTVLGPRSVAARLAHARFFFDHRRELGMPPAMRLRLVDEHGEAAQGNELYLDLPGAVGALSLRDALPPAARFLHPDYLSAYPESVVDHNNDEDEANGADGAFEDTRSEWLDWLRDHVGVNVVPRVLSGHITPEFLEHASALEGRELLVSLRAWWPRLLPHLSNEGVRALGAISIGGRRLDTLYLRRGALARLDVALELPAIPVDDPEDSAWDFLEKLGVATRISASLFLNKLVHMQAKGEKDYDAVEDIYKQLDARFDEDEMSIKKAFSQYPIILVSVKDEVELVWLRRVDVYWHGPPSMRSKAVISRSYAHLSNFFFNKLGIAQAPPFALVDELRMIVARYRGGPVPPEGWKHVAEILADISDAIQKMPSIPGSFKVLAEIAAFPVRVPAEGITLRPIDEFYVPDRASKYANVFRERVALLELPDSVPMTRIRPLLESDILKDRIRYLDPHVTKRSVPQGKQVMDPDTTGLYSSRVGYMARLIFHNSNTSDLSSEQTKVLAKLHKITVISVQSITTTLSLDTCRETTPEDVTFKETDDKFTVFVSRTRSPGKSINAPICRALSSLIEVDMMTLYTCITNPAEEVNYLFEMNKIAEIPVDDGHDRSWLQAIIQPNLPIIPTPIITEKSLSPGPPLSSPPRSPTSLSVHDEDPFPPLGAKPARNLRHAPSPSPSTSSFQQPSSNERQRQRSLTHGSVGVSRFSQFAQSPQTSYNSGPLQPAGLGNAIRDVNRLVNPAEAFVNGSQMQMMTGGSLAVPVWPPFADFNAPVSTEETDLVGIMGEHFVYKELIRMLDDFGPDNWTSELRTAIPGFTPFRGRAYADFTYLDRQGQLTRRWFGAEKATAWHGRWPRYHIEVKSTRGEENEPFHMSGKQMSTAIAFAERDHNGEDMYVIARVWGIGTSEPRYMPYLDPNWALFSGYLQYASDVYLQRST